MIVGEVFEFTEWSIGGDDASDADSSRSSFDESCSDIEDDDSFDTDTESSDEEEESEDAKDSDFMADQDDFTPEERYLRFEAQHFHFEADQDDFTPVERCRRLEEQPKSSAFDVTRVLQIFFARSTSLPEKYKDSFLDIADVPDLYVASGKLRLLLGNLLADLKEAIDSDNFKYVDNIICFMRNVYIDLINDPVTTEAITEPEFAMILVGFLNLRELNMFNKHATLQILAVLSCNSRVIAHLLMKKNSVDMLTGFLRKFENRDESSKLDFSTLIWAVLPAETYSDNGTQKMHDVMRNEKVKAMCKPIWYWRDSEGFWIPFTPLMNAEIEDKHKKLGEINYVNSGIIHTINFQKMQDVNEATSERRSIMRKVTEHCSVPSLSKTTACSCVSDCFAKFSYEFFNKRILKTHVGTPEHFRCWEGLRALLRSVTDQQLSELLRDRDSGSGDLLPMHVQELLYGSCTDLKILAMDIVSDLMRRGPKRYYIHWFEIERTIMAIRLMAQDYEVTNLLGEADQQNREKKIWLRAEAQKFIEDYELEMGDKKFEIMQDFNINDLENVQLDILYNLFISAPCTYQPPGSLRSGILSYFIYFLTSTRAPTDRQIRLREFMELLTNIPISSKIEGQRILGKKFLELLRKLEEIVMNILIQSNPWLHGKWTYKDTYIPGMNTVEMISKCHLNLYIHDKINSMDLKVAPFTSVEYLENFMIHKLSGRRGEFRDEVLENVTFRIGLCMRGNRLPSKMSIYEAIRHFGLHSEDKNIFEKTHKIEFLWTLRSGPQTGEFELFPHPLDRHLRERSPCPGVSEELSRALQLIDVLYGLNEYWTTLYSGYNHQYIINPRRFYIEAIDDYVQSALNDPFSAMMGMLRSSSVGEVIRNCPLILSLPTRSFAFKVVCTDRRRALMAVLDENPDHNRTINSHSGYPKVIVERNSVLMDIDEALRSTRPFSHWSVTFKDEVGAGMGLTNELFTLASRELQKAEFGLWASSGVTETGYLQVDTGLYPAASPRLNQPNENVHLSDLSLLDTFKSVGLLMGKALLDGQLLDLPLALPVFKWLLNQECELSLEDVVHVNPAIHEVLQKIQCMVVERNKIKNDPYLTEDLRNGMMKNINVRGETVDSYLLDFVLPGVVEVVELIPDGSNTSVSLENACLYLQKVEDCLLKSGVQKQMDSLRLGLGSVISLDHLQMFRPEELMTMICGEDNVEYWSVKHMKTFVLIDGFKKEERANVFELFRLWSSLCGKKQRLFLQFITGYSRLPVGGFQSLNPPLRVSCCTGAYPYAQTCFNTLNMPAGMTSSEMKKFISFAISEGLNCFGIV